MKFRLIVRDTRLTAFPVETYGPATMIINWPRVMGNETDPQ